MERWAFVPRRLLNHLYPLFRNEAAAAKTYGLDGEINLVIRNDDGRPGSPANEQAILLFGMGRGGDAVFAVDVTNPDARNSSGKQSGGGQRVRRPGPDLVAPDAARVNDRRHRPRTWLSSAAATIPARTTGPSARTAAAMPSTW